jgi:hypothetical protein
MGHNRNLADYAHHFDGTNIDLGSGNIETEGVVTYEDVTNVDAIGIVTARAGVKVPDSQKIFLGTGDDLQIFHNGSNSYIDNVTGHFYIRNYSDDNDIYIQTDNGSGGLVNYLFCDGSSGRVVLSHYGSGKIETSSTGATVTGTLVSDGVTSELDLSAISSSISDTAVDVFVYDTRKDSDGGAWRKRTQHTSWYNETLNTSSRGSRKEFPAVAVLVLESDCTLTIYDGDDPDLPMWMKFYDGRYTSAVGAEYMIGSNYAPATSLSMKNARIVVGRNDSTYSVYGQRITVVDFIRDEAQRSHSSYAAYVGNGNGPHISNRNQGGWGKGTPDMLGNAAVVNSVVNDLAMTVLPNAPIDDATGLPIPTIAVATNAGVSVIKDDGTVVDWSTLNNKAIKITSDKIYTSYGTNGRIYVDPIPTSDLANYGGGQSSGVERHYRNTLTSSLSTDDDLYYLGYFSDADSVISASSFLVRNTDEISVGTGGGLTNISENPTSPANGMVAYATTSYNTGWMHGDIKGAFLSDTDTTNVSADTLNAVNAFDGTFASSTGWTADSDWSISGGVATCNGNNSGRFIYPTNDRWSYNRSVVVEVTVTAYTSGTLSISYGTGGATSGTNMTATGTYKFVNVTTGNDLIYIRSDSFVGSIDNVKIYYTEEDRSVNNNGLIPYGTITKSAVATGAELVAYRPPAAANGPNYLARPLNSADFDLTSDWSITFWARRNGQTADNYSGFEIAEDDVSANNAYAKIPFSIYIDNAGNTGWRGANVTGYQYNTLFGTQDVWKCVTTVNKSGNLYIYVNGEYVTSTPATFANPSNPYSLSIFRFTYSSTRHDGRRHIDYALFKMSESAPSAEQIKKMYEDEKVLFQENAKATLYGSSDAVTALAYDEDTELLHVGTSAGRSDFQGLRRINNTTTAVTTAISASDELIAEQ